MLAVAGQALALGPHEVLVLANGKSEDSIEVAREYARLRNIPEINILRLNLPWASAAVPLAITPAEFSANIWEPAIREIKNRGIGDHILAWAYSVDFPTTIAFDPELSIQGLTFLRNKLPDPESVKKGVYSSPLFAGPENPKGKKLSAQTFDVFSSWLGDEMPLPSMMLGYTGVRGNGKDVVLKCLQSGAASDGTAPQGTVYFITGEDIRATTRAWQFSEVVKELRILNVAAVITNALPSGGQKIIGLMCGTAWVKPEEGTNVFLPGSMAEHFTSFAGAFGSADQSKLTAWIQAGASASAGTVTEPFSIWTKVPSARFFPLYAAGCSMIESFYQSIRCPLQVLLVGDPLARPWAEKCDLVITGLSKEEVGGVVKIGAEVPGARKGSYRKFMFMLDGKVVGNDKLLELDTAALAEGVHLIRAVAYKTGVVRNQAFAERKIIVKKGVK